MKVTDEQLRQIGRSAHANCDTVTTAKYELESGRAALKTCAEILLAEPTNDEINSEFNWNEGPSKAIRAMFANRLKSVLAEPDAAVEAVAGILCKLDHAEQYSYPEEAAKIVALVRSADKAGAK